MATKSNKENTSKKDVLPKTAGINKSSAKSKKIAEDDLDLGDETPLKAGRKSLSVKDEDEHEDDIIGDIEEDDDNLIKGEADKDWDPDFDEFDVPKSSKKTTLKKSSKGTDDDYKIDDEFKDYFGSKSSSKKYNEDDDY